MIVAVLQSRLTSNRLPGKVLLPILGQPMLVRQIERVRRARAIDVLKVATSTDASDDPIAGLCRQLGIHCFRGSLGDVLDRFFQATQHDGAEYIVRLTGDCPLIDAELIDRVVRFTREGGFDYASNTLEPSFPDGLDVEVFRFRCLEEAWREAQLPSEREHVTPFIYRQPRRYRLGSYKAEVDLSALRWTVDYPEDYEFVRQVYEDLFPSKPCFTTADVLDLLKRRPELPALNAGVTRNAGYKKSLEQDAEFLAGKKPS